MIWVWKAWLGLAAAGVFTSTGFLFIALAAAWRFRRQHAGEALPEGPLPPATMMKPLCGLEPRLEENLETFFTQDYPEFEILFGTRNGDDPALSVVERLRQRYPQVKVRVVFSGEPDRPNAKVCTLRKMFESAAYEHVVISDSDVGVGANYLRRVVAQLRDEKIGLVMCLYRGVPTGGLWSAMEALGMSVEMTGGVLASALLGEIEFALGPTMATRRAVVEKIGGIGQLADFCADDYELGRLTAKAGWKVIMSGEIIEHFVVNRSFAASMRHNKRWMTSTRFSIPAGHASSVLGFAMPFGLLGAAAGALAGHPALGLGLLAWATANRVLMSLGVGWGVVRDWRALAFCWAYPLRDLMGFFFWLASYSGDSVEWRGERYRLLRGGRMARADAATHEAVAAK